MPTIGSFCLIKNEARFINRHIAEWLPFLDEMVFFDGGSTDGTLEILKQYADTSPKIKLFEGKDPSDLQDDYVNLSNGAMWALGTDLAIFLHPDMFPANGETLRRLPDDLIAAAVEMESYAGDPGESIYRIEGRGSAWKTIYRLRNPNLGAHYHGHYGAHNEDTYFSEITGDKHEHYGTDFSKYPYPVNNSGLIIKHFSDVRPYARRLDRMIKCLINQGHSPKAAQEIAPQHPRVSLKDGMGFKFIKSAEEI